MCMNSDYADQLMTKSNIANQYIHRGEILLFKHKLNYHFE